jgi:hypothetical protein
MNNTNKNLQQIDPLDQNNYSIETLEDIIRVDQLCKKLLKQYHQYLLKEKVTEPFEARIKASGADFFLRDFIIDNQQKNIFHVSAELVRRFAGNWYIVSTLEPNIKELKSILKGIDNFYAFCAAKKLVNPSTAAKINLSCAHVDYYQQRINSFHDLIGDGYATWNNECPLS